MPHSVLVLTGPTASGKTSAAIWLAQRFHAEIVSADSRQIYRGMPIGTAAPTPEQLAAVPHHLIGFLDPTEQYSAARFKHDAEEIIAGIHGRGNRAIVAGGTGFYIRALTGDVALSPEYNQEIRDRLAQEIRVHGTEFLYEWLQHFDPQRASKVRSSDTYRITRALEILLANRARKAFPGKNAPTPSNSASRPWQYTKIVLDTPLGRIDENIEQRTDRMLEQGLIEEAERIGAAAVAANAVGYPQGLAFLQGWMTRDELRTALIRATRRYARRQRTWFRSEPNVTWLAPETIESYVMEHLHWNEPVPR